MFTKKAFARREHLKVARAILARRFNEQLFDQIQEWMDRVGGKNHRITHGHDSEAEKYIQDNWGDIGVEMFHIHILVDRVQDELPKIVRQRLDEIREGQREVPYFEVSTDSAVPYCRGAGVQHKGAADPEAKMQIIEPQCANCGSVNDLDLSRWIRGFLCKECITTRAVEVCCHCRSLFAAQLRVPDSINEGKFICPVCNERSGAQ